jgi:hypothetical protein
MHAMLPFLNGINDLTNNYYLYILLLKREVILHQRFPIFNPYLFGGRTVIGDAFNMFYYPINWIYIFLPFDAATIINIILHLFVMVVGLYLLLTQAFKIEKKVAIGVAILGALWPKWFYHITVGHIMLLQSIAWFPYIFLLLIKICAKNYKFRLKDAVLFACVSLLSFFSSNFFFLHIALFLFIFFIFKVIFEGKKIPFFEVVKFVAVALVLFFVNAGFQIVPEVKFALSATRGEAAASVLPLWSYKNLFWSMFFPYINLPKFEAEQFLYPGIIILFGGLFSLIKAKIENKKALIVSLLVMFLISVNFKTPFFRFFQMIPGMTILRVTARFWIFGYFIFLIFFADLLRKINKKALMIIFAVLVCEYLIIDVIRLVSPNQFGDQKDARIYTYLKKQYGTKKIYTTGAFLSQYYVGVNDLRLVAGESPWQEQRYMERLKKAGGYPWFHEYAVIYPPWQAEQVHAQPSAELLCQLKGEVVLSKYALIDPAFQYIAQIDKIKLYENHCPEY